MPHLILEHSADLAESHDLAALSRDLLQMALNSDVFGDKPAIKVRTISCDNVLSGSDDPAFAQLTLRLIAGRPVEVRRALADELLDILIKHLPDVEALSVRPVEIELETYAKRAVK